MVKQLNMGVLGAVALLTPFSALATTFNCGSSHPTCAQLGFNQTANECKGYKAIKCPFNEQALFCGDSANVPESVPGNESMTCSTRDCDALGYNRTAEECERTHTRLACPFDDDKFYCGGYNCVAGDTLYTDANNNVGCWKGSDANGKTPIGFMLNDKVAIDLSFYGSAYSGENYVRNIGGHSGQIVWRNVGVQSGIVCEKKTSSATGLFSAVTNEVKDCNGAPFSEVEVPYGNVFSINDYDQTFSNAGVATSGGYYTTTTSNNGYYITNLLANNGAFNINIDRYVPVCNVTAMEQLLEDVCDISPATISSENFTKLKENVLREIYAMRELKKSVYSPAVTGQTWLPYMNSLPTDKLNVTWTRSSPITPKIPNAATQTAAAGLMLICKDLRSGNCASPYIDASTNKFRPIVKVKPLLAQNYAKPHVVENFGLRGATVPQTVAELSETFQSTSVLPSRTIYNCSCGMKKVEQFPMMRIKELNSGFINPRMTSINANGVVSFAPAPSGAAATRKIGLSSEAAKLCVGRTSGGQDWFLPAPGDIKNLMEDSEMLEKYRQALLAASNNSTVFPSGFNGQNLANVKSPEVLMKRELGRTITSAMYLSNSSGTTTGVMCPLQRGSNATDRDKGDVTYSWDLQLSLLGDVVHCVTLVGVDASQYENVAKVGKKSICGDSDPAVPAVSRPSRFSSIIEAREKIVPGVDLSNEATMSVSAFSGISASSFHDSLDKKGL